MNEQQSPWWIDMVPSAMILAAISIEQLGQVPMKPIKISSWVSLIGFGLLAHWLEQQQAPPPEIGRVRFR